MKWDCFPGNIERYAKQLLVPTSNLLAFLPSFLTFFCPVQHRRPKRKKTEDFQRITRVWSRLTHNFGPGCASACRSTTRKVVRNIYYHKIESIDGYIQNTCIVLIWVVFVADVYCADGWKARPQRGTTTVKTNAKTYYEQTEICVVYE